MNKSEARKLQYCDIEFENIFETRAFDMLLTRVLGRDTFKIAKRRNRYAFIYWATPEEMELIDDLWDQVLFKKWDEEEFEELMK